LVFIFSQGAINEAENLKNNAIALQKTSKIKQLVIVKEGVRSLYVEIQFSILRRQPFCIEARNHCCHQQ
jgi:hypothetical protein